MNGPLKCEMCDQKLRNVDHGTCFCSRRCKDAFALGNLLAENPKGLITRLYVSQKLSLREIAEKRKISTRSVTKLLEDYKIPVREGSAAIKNQWRGNASRRSSQAVRFAKSTATRKPTRAERKMIKILNSLRVAYHFQYPIDRYIADFALPSKHAVIEVDGREHKATRPADAQRTAVLNRHGWRVFRLSNEAVLKRPKEVQRILWRIFGALSDSGLGDRHNGNVR